MTCASARVGRQIATQGFLRAAVAARGARPVTDYGAAPLAEAFAKLIANLDPAAPAQWVAHDHLKRFRQLGVCHRPALSGGVHTAAPVLDQLAAWRPSR
jgi:hypothetical protein